MGGAGEGAYARRPVQRFVVLPFDAAMNAVLAEGYPGGSLAVVRDGKLVYTRGYGFAKAGVAATPITRYRQASVSKAVTGSLLAQLVTNGTLTMDLRVFPYLGVA